MKQSTFISAPFVFNFFRGKHVVIISGKTNYWNNSFICTCIL